jgi:hypothetical protein
MSRTSLAAVVLTALAVATPLALATPASAAAPDAPNAPAVAHGNGAITVTFTSPPDGGSTITNYTAGCVSSDSGTPGSQTGTDSPIVVSGLDNGKTYTCTVTATNNDGDSLPSDPSATVVPSTVPDAPAKPTVVHGNGRVTVSFVGPADGGSAILDFTAICTSTNGGATGTVTETASPITVTGLTNGKSYTCTVSARNDDGAGPSSPASNTVVPSRTPNSPAAPTVKAGDARIRVSFSAPGNGGASISGYLASCISSNGGVARAVSGASSPITVTRLSNTKTYRCRVAAENKNGYSAPSSASTAVIPRAVARGYRLVAGDGSVYVFGNARHLGSANNRSWTPVVGMASTPTGNGYWLVNMAGQVWAFGDAPHFGQPRHLNKPVVGISATPTGRGYWLVATDGGVFSYGDARFYGSTGNIRLRKPIVGMASTPNGRGYWMVASDGGVFTFGNGHFYGSAARVANQSIVGMATTATGRGYWLAGAKGGVYSYGDAARLGGTTANLRYPISSIASTPTGKGYWLVAGDGGVFAKGDAPWYRWKPTRLKQTIRAISR